MSTPKFTPKPLPDDEIRLAQELCVDMGECAASYHIVIQLGEIKRLRQINTEMYEALEACFQNAILFNHDSDACWVVIRDMCRAALAKAVTK